MQSLGTVAKTLVCALRVCLKEWRSQLVEHFVHTFEGLLQETSGSSVHPVQERAFEATLCKRILWEGEKS